MSYSDLSEIEKSRIEFAERYTTVQLVLYTVVILTSSFGLSSLWNESKDTLSNPRGLVLGVFCVLCFTGLLASSLTTRYWLKIVRKLKK